VGENSNFLLLPPLSLTKSQLFAKTRESFQRNPVGLFWVHLFSHYVDRIEGHDVERFGASMPATF